MLNVALQIYVIMTKLGKHANCIFELMDRIFQRAIVLIILNLFLGLTTFASGREEPDTAFIFNTINMPDSSAAFISVNNEEINLLSARDSISSSKFKIKKRIAAILAFPFPFGLLGLHRVFLGTKPYIPFVYIGTLGGCFLILPMIDFIAILSANEEELKKFENNPRVFMWSK